VTPASAATIAVIGGRIRVGLTRAELEALGRSSTNHKVSVRDLGVASARGYSGGTTVAASLFAASRAGIEVFATGGIGGVHREPAYDISADLLILSQTPVICVCSGAKSILDLRATLEMLETLSVPVVGYGTDAFPGFFARSSGFGVSGRLDTPQEIADYWLAHCDLGLRSAVLIANPIPRESEIPDDEMERWISVAAVRAAERGVHGPALTPFMLSQIAEQSAGRSIRANLSLLENNVKLASIVARELAGMGKAKNGNS
jgi:pseudouridylate synthase